MLHQSLYISNTSYISNTILDGTGLVNQDIVSITSGENNALLYGLSIKNGNFINMGRAGVCVSNSSHAVIDNVIIENIFTDGHGPGVFINNQSNVVIKNSIIRNNTSRMNGGGIYIEILQLILILQRLHGKYLCFEKHDGSLTGHGGGISIWSNSDA